MGDDLRGMDGEILLSASSAPLRRAPFSFFLIPRVSPLPASRLATLACYAVAGRFVGLHFTFLSYTQSFATTWLHSGLLYFRPALAGLLCSAGMRPRDMAYFSALTCSGWVMPPACRFGKPQRYAGSNLGSRLCCCVAPPPREGRRGGFLFLAGPPCWVWAFALAVICAEMPFARVCGDLGVALCICA